MTTDSQDRADNAQTDGARHETTRGLPLAEPLLRCASRIAGRALPGNSVRRFADAVLDRHRTDGRTAVFARQVEERLAAFRLEEPAQFFDRRQIPASHPAAEPWDDRPDQRAQQADHGPSRTLPQLPSLGNRLAPAGRAAGTDEKRAPAGAEPFASPLPDAVIQSLPLRLDEPVRRLMARMLDIRIPAVKIYANQAADQVARRFHADAVAFGDSILFRSGRYEPSTARGLGLLGHELTHAAQARMRSAGPAAFDMPDTPEGAALAESTALANERRILNRLSGSPAPGQTGMFSTPGSFSAPRAPAAKPPAVQTAATDRAVAGDTVTHDPMDSFPSAQLQQIKDAVYRDLMERLRTEFERGG